MNKLTGCLVLSLSTLLHGGQSGVYIISNNGIQNGDEYLGALSTNLMINDHKAYCTGTGCSAGSIVLGGYATAPTDGLGMTSVDNGHCMMGSTDNNFITLIIPENLSLFGTSATGLENAGTYFTEGNGNQVSQLCYDMGTYLIKNFSSYGSCLINFLNTADPAQCTLPCSFNACGCSVPSADTQPFIGEYVNLGGTSYCYVGFSPKSGFKLRINTNVLTGAITQFGANTNSLGQPLATNPLITFTDGQGKTISCTVQPDLAAQYASSLSVLDLVTAYSWFLSYNNWINGVYNCSSSGTTGTTSSNPSSTTTTAAACRTLSGAVPVSFNAQWCTLEGSFVGYQMQCPLAPVTTVTNSNPCTNKLPAVVQTAYPAFATAYADFITNLNSYIAGNASSAPTPPTAPAGVPASTAVLTMPLPPALQLVCTPASAKNATDLQQNATAVEQAQIEQFFNQAAGQLGMPPLFGDQTSLNTYLSQQISGAVAQQCPNISLGLQTLFTTCANTASGNDFIGCVTNDPSYISLLPMSDSSTDPLYFNGVCLNNLDSNLASILLNYMQVLQNQTFVADAALAASQFSQTISQNLQISSCVGAFTQDGTGVPVITYMCPITNYGPDYTFRLTLKCNPNSQTACQAADGSYNLELYSIESSLPMGAIFQSPQLPLTDQLTGEANNTDDFSCGFCGQLETISPFNTTNPFNAFFEDAQATRGMRLSDQTQPDPVCCNGFVAQFASTPPESCVINQQSAPNMLFVSNFTAKPVSVALASTSGYYLSGSAPTPYAVSSLASRGDVTPQQVPFGTNNWGLPQYVLSVYGGAGGVWVGAYNWATSYYVNSTLQREGNWATASPSAIALGISQSMNAGNQLTYVAFNGGPFDPSTISGLALEWKGVTTVGTCPSASINQLQCVEAHCSAYDSRFNNQITNSCYDAHIS